ncbi:helix-turn-helix transcriptional regulator [Pontibacter sp. KCTC 32443]|uniref:winged helix-turn-helix transcriptional regulator n=1 Tax=Pontibacter TaxID=323449 RepID=UPI00164E4443|nr:MULTISPECIES: helix-turn-helix domain-containing protein [Pontibacter]MBC5774694.1 helix-turn-helix transcriptional regulator [Pontibacter sp. KCTC 32443]
MGVTKTDNQQLKVREKIDKILLDKASNENCCPVKDILGRFGDKWSIYTILMLGRKETLRFNELKTLISGISQRMLTVTLRSLEEDGLVKRTIYPEIPPRVEYELTALGHSLLLKLLELADWAKLNIHQIIEAREVYAGKKSH